MSGDGYCEAIILRHERSRYLDQSEDRDGYCCQIRGQNSYCYIRRNFLLSPGPGVHQCNNNIANHFFNG